MLSSTIGHAMFVASFFYCLMYHGAFSLELSDIQFDRIDFL